MANDHHAQSTFLSFKQGNVNAMRGKVSEFDDGFRNEIVGLLIFF